MYENLDEHKSVLLAQIGVGGGVAALEVLGVLVFLICWRNVS